MNKLILLIIFAISLFAIPTKPITLEWLQNQPKSYAKDFYIWRYLKQNITPSQANQALSQVRYLNNKIFYRYINRSKNKNLIEYKRCIQTKTKDLIDKPPYCIEAGLSIYDATKLSKLNLTKVIKKLQPEYKQFTKKLDILNSSTPFKTLEQSEPKIFFDTFNMTGSKYRIKYFNQYFPLSLFKKLKQNKYKKNFAQTIKLIVTNLNMTKAQASLLNLSPEGLSFKAVFHLAINAIRHNKENLALIYLENALDKAYYRMDKDNIIFWQYQLTKKKKYLEKLSKSWDTNLYSLYGQNLLNIKQTNIIYNIQQNKNSKLVFDKTDPFKWLKVLKDSKKMDKQKLQYYTKLFNQDETLGHLAFVKERFDRYRNSYFVTPYNKYLHKLPKNRQALIYAISRQESRFIPTSISSAYAMGAMQIMPFLSKAIAKELKVPYNIDEQLLAKTNLKYANHHLNFLDKRLHNPLFIAYAYNGGIGFTTRLLKTNLFKKGKYEPFLSMELLPYDETKKYGKKVLANYFIYQNHLNSSNPISFDNLVEY